MRRMGTVEMPQWPVLGRVGILTRRLASETTWSRVHGCCDEFRQHAMMRSSSGSDDEATLCCSIWWAAAGFACCTKHGFFQLLTRVMSTQEFRRRRIAGE